jgi:hypothetical protein
VERLQRLFADQPDYVAYTSWRNTLAEDAMKDFLVSHADLPRGARLWTFGTARHAATMGGRWQRRLVAGKGFVTLRFDDAQATLVSPADQVLRSDSLQTLYLGLREGDSLESIEVHARIEPAAPWQEIVPATPAGSLVRAAPGLAVPLAWPADWRSRAVIAESFESCSSSVRNGTGAHRPHCAVSAGQRRYRSADSPLMAPARPTLAHLDALTGVRALAALWVFVYHAWLASGATRSGFAGATAGRLHAVVRIRMAGLDIFFVLSGFLLTRQEWIRLERKGNHDEVRRLRPFFAFCGTFLRKRILRVYPAYYGCLTLLMALAATHLYLHLPERLDLLLHLGMFHNAVDAYVSTLNGVFWTLPFEWQFYLFFPLLFVLLVRSGPLDAGRRGALPRVCGKGLRHGDRRRHDARAVADPARCVRAGHVRGSLCRAHATAGRLAPSAFYAGLLVLLATPLVFFDLPTGNHYYSLMGFVGRCGSPPA